MQKTKNQSGFGLKNCTIQNMTCVQTVFQQILQCMHSAIKVKSDTLLALNVGADKGDTQCDCYSLLTTVSKSAKTVH